MSYTRKFILSLMENNFLDFEGLDLTNEELDYFINVFNSRDEKSIIKNIILNDNKIQHYSADKLLAVFQQLQHIYVSDIQSIDISPSKPIHITVK